MDDIETGIDEESQNRRLLQPEGSEVRPEEAPAAAEQPRARETVLVAEDDKATMAVIKRTLEVSGYTVIEVPYAKTVVEQFLQNKDNIRLVLCDVMMPGMSGAEIKSAVRAAVPDIPILFMSGYAGESVAQEKGSIISKPFSPEALLQRVRNVIDGKPDS